MMKAATLTTDNIGKCLRVAILIIGVAAAYACTPPTETSVTESSATEEVMLLSGRVTSTGGEVLVGVPVKAHLYSLGIFFIALERLDRGLEIYVLSSAITTSQRAARMASKSLKSSS